MTTELSAVSGCYGGGVVLSLDTGKKTWKKERKDGPGPGQGRPGEATTANSVLGHEGGGAQSALAYESDV